jgi:hypothetical protein
MRDYKFRGKRVDNDEWAHGNFAEFVNYLDGDAKPGIQIIKQVPSGFDRMIPAFETELVEVIPESVGQFTGLHDKNDFGKEIYERDICSFIYNGEKRIEEVWFCNGSFSLGFCMTLHQAFQDCNKEVRESLEVIGNRFDNPSLLEVQP